jgi:hypothetical protein
MAGQQQPGNPEQKLGLPVPGIRYRSALGHPQVPLRRLHRAVHQLVRRGGPVQLGDLIRPRPPEFQPQEVGEHLVVPEPGPS